jgi:hypothetical protein
MAEIGVIHLVRAANGVEPFRRFLESYTQHRGALRHDLLIVFKGFGGEHELGEYRRLLEGFSYQQILASDTGYDVESYFVAANTFHNRFYCFLNSFSVILDDHWLTHLYEHVSSKDVGLVGATGSGTSWYSQVVENRHALKTMAVYRGPIGRLRLWLRMYYYSFHFERFPNYHIRTNGFMIARNLFLHIHRPRRSTKLAMYLFESGKHSLTNQIRRVALQTLVIGRDGRAYTPDTWWESNTFWQNNQSNLLVADNQTNKYTCADIGEKWRLAKTAWGTHAHVGEPRRR